ncbi:MAG: class I SAM-dependent methyltransferase, partial [Chloroflexota bacterium]|nr:class I SAM-dependent methyltransferase [Chloroflexota bacterium]
SSHEVDAGSRLLLRSLDPDALPKHGRAFDYGCGYGVLGLALKQVRPEWSIELIDRDALAVAFSEWNAERFGWNDASGIRCRVGLGVESASPEGVDLVLWNVPGKAGRQVLERLTRDATGALAVDGLLALVVVNPLAEILRAAIAVERTVSIEAESMSADHTVMLARRLDRPGDEAPFVEPPFTRGVFDRAARRFEWRDLGYTITPVVGLPEYDSRDYATDCALDLITGLDRPIDRAIVQGVGQGHVPVVLKATHRPQTMTLIDRDLLALEASRRALFDAAMSSDNVLGHVRADLGPVETAPGCTLVTILLPDQQSPRVSDVQIRDITDLAECEIDVVVSGSSTSVTRFLSLASRNRGWQVKSRRKRHGASAAILSVDGR